MSKLKEALGRIREPDGALAASARERLDRLTKPPGSLGALEDLAVRLCAATGSLAPRAERRVAFCFAADHGVAARGVSAYPQAVTAQMVLNFLGGGAAINVLARQASARVVVADFGVREPLGERPGLLTARLGPGTADFSREPAMSAEQAERAVEAGLAIALTEIDRGADVLATGEMGIGNTTAASAITAAVTGADPAEVTGYGTGIDEAGRRRKAEVIAGALALHRPDPEDGFAVLAAVGGFEIGGLAGVLLAGAARRVPVIVDGFISTAAALIAWRLAPEARHYWIAAHRSAERGHAAALDLLGLSPLLSLGLRLGEGTGAVLALPLVDAACRVMTEMATFESAGVSERDAER